MQISEATKQSVALPSEALSLFSPNEGSTTILDVVIVFAKRKWLILKIAAVVSAVAILVSLLLPNRYTATATIMPPRQSQSAAAMLVSQMAAGAAGSLASIASKDLGIKDPNDLYVGILKSRTIQDTLVSQFQLQQVYRDKRLSEARKELASNSNIVAGKDSLIDISFEDKDPRRAAAIANAYVEELRRLMQHLAVTEAAQRRMFFEQQLLQAKEDLKAAEVALKETQQKTGMIQLDAQSKAMIEAVGQIRAQIAAQEVQLQAMGSFATEQNPDFVLARKQLSALRDQLAKFEQQEPSNSGDPLMASGRIPAAGLEYVRRLREMKYRELIFELLAKQYEAAKLDEAKDAAIIQVVDRATEPDKKSWPHRGIIATVAALCGILIGCVTAFCAEALERMKENGRFSEQLSLLRFYVRSGKSI